MTTPPPIHLLRLAFFLSNALRALAWGIEGHRITCLLAEPLFSQATADAVQDLLPESAKGSLAKVCSWADEVRRRRNWRWSSPLHFIDTPDFRCSYNYKRDCHDKKGDPDMCLAGAINNFTSQLTMYGSAQLQYNLTEALMFLAHFVGDIHQPLHVGFTGDEGGNTIILRWYKRKENLHHIWDDEFIDMAKKRYYNSDLLGLVDYLSKNITGNLDKASKWGDCHSTDVTCPDVYATESIKAACRWAYRNATPGSQLGDDYFLSRLPIVEQRLSQGGVRLAATLNRIFERKEVASQ